MKTLITTPFLSRNKNLSLIVPYLFLLAACGENTSSTVPPTPAVVVAPQALEADFLTEVSGAMSPAVGSTLVNCSALNTQFAFDQTVITYNSLIAEDTVRGLSVGAHCLIRGQMNRRVSPIDGNDYAIGFEMRLPRDWNGRFFYQANGGIDGSVVPAIGGLLGRGATDSALGQGFAVISSDAGHQRPTPFFGLDPQARLDYGYNAVAELTPMAKALIETAYGRTPDRSYFVGCSNGGRHAMVAAARYADQYDGILAGNPGFNLPQAAVAQLYGAQQYSLVTTATNADGEADINTAFTATERSMIASHILARCDDLDGLADGIVGDSMSCQATFDLERDVPTCAGERDGSCLSEAQKSVLDNVMDGARNSAGEAVYTSFPYDPGILGSDWAGWKFGSSQTRDPGAGAFIFTTPPSSIENFTSQSGLEYALNFSMDTDAPRIYATNDVYTESPMSYMTPPNPSNLSALRDRGARMMVFHGLSDGVFSPDDTVRWYNELNEANDGTAGDFTRLYLIPGMNHCGGGPATDQFDMVSALVAWVEQGEAPDRVIAAVRGGENTELPADWSADRTRPLCPYPQVARYSGNGDTEDAASFICEAP